jgi:hypothetical protein
MYIGEFYNKKIKWFSRHRCEVSIEINAQNYFFFTLSFFWYSKSYRTECFLPRISGERNLFWNNDRGYLFLRDPTESVTPTRLRTETDPVSEMLCSLLIRMPDDGQIPKTVT